MSTEQPEFDWTRLSPVAMWRDWIVQSEAQWSEMLSGVFKHARAGGLATKQIDELRMLQRMYGEMAQAALGAANLPSRTDLEALDERMGRLEDGLARLSAEVVKLRDALAMQAKPRRERKP